MDVSITPSLIPFDGAGGDTVVEMVTLKNNENSSVDISIQYDAVGLTIVPDDVLLGPNASETVGIVYIIQSNATSGNITFEWIGSILVVSVDIDEAEDEPSQVEAPVEIFPSSPRSGSSIAIFFTGEHEGCSASGFLHCNGFIYQVDMVNGFGIVSLDGGAYGIATLYLFGGAVSEEDSRKTFAIERGESKFLQFSASKTATVDSGVEATLTFGGELLGNQEVTVTSPSDISDTYITDNKGRIEFTVDEIGRWRLMTTSGGQMATASTEVDYAVLPLGIIEEDPQVGDAITIVTESEAFITVMRDTILMGEFIASSDGFIPFTLSEGGRYTLDGKLDKMRGTFSFQIPGKAEIVILDTLTRMPVETVEPNKQFIIEARDPSGKILTGADAVWISNPFGTREYLTLKDGEGLWTPFVRGAYTLSVDETASCAAGSRYVLIMPPAGQFGWLVGLIIFLLMVIAVMLVLAVYSKRRGMPLRVMLNSVMGREKKPELPIG